MDFLQLEPQPQCPLANPPYDRWLSESGETVVEFHRAKDGFLLRFRGLGDFAVAADHSSVICTPAPDARPEAMRDLYLNQVIPMVLGHRGEVVVHASAVAVAAGVLGFAGPSGRGKSTLAAALARSGYPFLTDDGLILDRSGEAYLVRPNLPSLRLREDSEEALFGLPEGAAKGKNAYKQRIVADDRVPFQQTPKRLQAIYFLGNGNAQTTEIVRLKPAAALSTIINCCFILDVEDRQRLRGHFDRLAGLVGVTPCFTLDYPREYDYLPEVLGAIIDHAGRGELAT